MFRDPVSGAKVRANEAVAVREHAGELFYFVSQENVDEYDADPHYYGHQNPYYEEGVSPAHHHHHSGQ